MEKKMNLKIGETLYTNPLNSLTCLKDFIEEGQIEKSIENDSVVLGSPTNLNPDDDGSHWVLWNKQTFPSNIIIEYDFKPLKEAGLCMLFFSASGEEGKDLFDKSLKERDGRYPQYHSSDINTYHLSYFRRKWNDERSFHTCNLRKSSGFHLVEQAPDPIPSTEDVEDYYHLKIMKYEGIIQFFINDLFIFEYVDDGVTFGDVLQDGKIGFRQMAPLKGAYKNLVISESLREE